MRQCAAQEHCVIDDCLSLAEIGALLQKLTR
jgi:hypothetical protein